MTSLRISFSLSVVMALLVAALMGCGSSNSQPSVDRGDAGDAGDVQIPNAPQDAILDGQAGSLLPACSRPLDETTAILFYDAAHCLFEGTDAPQKGVAQGTIDPIRVAIVRGRVFDVGGAALGDVRISVLHHPEYGETVTRADGNFDMAVNGGAAVTLRYEKAEFLVSQRHAPTAWHAFAIFPDVSLVQLSGEMNAVELGAASAVVRGPKSADASGARQPWVMFAPNTTAEMVLAGGTKQPLSSLHLRMTEYSIGDSGPRAMPGDLPLTSGYTYAAEFSIDEANQAGSSRVEFDPPVIGYVDNFLHFPVGTVVPLGAYDRDRDVWEASDSGQVVQILDVADGVAEVDADGDGKPDDAATLAKEGIGSDELKALAQQYQAGQSAWRVALSHFSTWDLNWPFGPPDDAAPPNGGASLTNPFDCRTEVAGSIIGCEDQSLGEAFPISGTPYSLHYQSERMAGRLDANQLDIQLSGSTLPSSLRRIELEVDVLGSSYQKTFEPLPNQRHVFAWDGKDVYGRTWQGVQQATVRIGYVYPGVYRNTTRFGYRGTGVVTGDKTRTEVTLWAQEVAPLGTLLAAPLGLGGFTIDVQHVYDPHNKILYFGDGHRRSADKIGGVATHFAGKAQSATMGSGDGGPATDADLVKPDHVVVAPDGTVFLSDAFDNKIRKISATGIITTYAGTGVAGFSGDGGPATEAQLSMPRGLALAPDGTLYVADQKNGRIRAIAPDRTITTLAGGGQSPDQDIPATTAYLAQPTLLALAPDGTLYFLDDAIVGMHLITPDGTFTTLNAPVMSGIDGIAVGANNVLYMSQVEPVGNGHISKLDAQGTTTTLLGAGNLEADWVPAEEAAIHSPRTLGLGPDGSVYFLDGQPERLRHVTPNGLVETLAGGGPVGVDQSTLLPALGASLGRGTALAVAPNGDVITTEGARLRRIQPGLPGFTGSDVPVASQDGTVVYVFNDLGKHLRTVDALTSITLQSFTYDGAGRLVAITDKDGNKTTVGRDDRGNPTSIIGPFGQTTKLAVGTEGYVSSVTNPNGETTLLSYKTGGLLETKVDPRDPGDVHRFAYDDLGRLQKDADPSGYAQTLTRTEGADSFSVTVQSTLGRARTLQVDQVSRSDFKTTETATDGTSSATSRTTVGIRQTSPTTTVDVTFAPDMRFGMQSRVAAVTDLQELGGPKVSIAHTRMVALNDPADPLSVETLTDTTTVNGRTFVDAWDASSLTWTSTSAAKRRTTRTLDKLGHLVALDVGDLLPMAFAYDRQGRVTSVTQDVRSVAFVYGSDGWLASVADPLGHMTKFTNDGVGRTKSTTFADGSVIALSYDRNGNLTSMAPPAKPDHDFTYLPGDLLGKYAPPVVDGSGDNNSTYSYDTDRMLSELLRPDRVKVTYAYDNAGRLSALTTPTGTVNYAYSDATGQLTTISGPYGQTVTVGYQGDLVTDETFSGVVPGTVHLSYDDQLRVATETVSGGASVSYTYDADGWLTQAGALTVGRNAQTPLIASSHLTAVADSYTYNGYGEVTGYLASANGKTVLQEDYARDAGGRIVENKETVQGATHVYAYAYDFRGQLKDVTVDGTPSLHHEYDANGNRVTLATSSGMTSATFDAQDRLLTQGSVSYTYGPNGELATRTDAGQTSMYTYDALGELTKVVLPAGQTIEYIYDGFGRRVAKNVDGQFVQAFLYRNALHPIAELDAAGNVVSRFVYASRDHVPDVVIQGNATYRIISDHLGSPRLVLNAATGAVAQRVDYDAWGNVLTNTAPGFQPFGFAGGIYDVDTGLVHFGARDYDPTVGRWTAKDPILFAGKQANLYAYAGDEPIDLVDPNGRAGLFVASGANAGLLGGVAGQIGGLVDFDAGPGLVASGGLATSITGAFAGVGGVFGIYWGSIDQFSGHGESLVVDSPIGGFTVLSTVSASGTLVPIGFAVSLGPSVFAPFPLRIGAESTQTSVWTPLRDWNPFSSVSHRCP